ncbi:hypothetical protein MXD63_36130, partial [Frankia sp. Cpl3]|nr:hypothetical protein [Frankia sp. Cpl3]
YIYDLYGVGLEADAFTIAVNIPMTLFLVVPGAINAVLIPTLRGILERADHRKAGELYHRLLAIVLLFFILLAVAGVAFSHQM